MTSEPNAVAMIVERLVGQIAAAPVDPAPSDNIYIEQAFSDEVYHEILARMPPDDAMDFLPHRDIVRDDRTSTRRFLTLSHETIERLPPNDRIFWRTMHAAFTDVRLTAAIMQKFGSTLRVRFGETLPALSPEPMMYRDYPGYFISPHPDALSKIATLQFYLPPDSSQAHLGTTFHRREGGTFVDLKTNRFLPNTAYAFVRTEESWHSVKQLGREESIRNTIALTYFLEGQEYRNPTRSM
ncbi:conserved hypothetical protein [uncultured Defluviicoccus sp.]|uniref:Prolyl 4-hydroxylase alpha subunit Fe(2+) 2OG dioxygenase domain-containing protein n=1 Tax=metagenome TaxID=256318 RepID=A0A380TD17_9ZZZZ|nr:conserved hypothetical protein [uncultured Defluviicoccus sp.]